MAGVWTVAVVTEQMRARSRTFQAALSANPAPAEVGKGLRQAQAIYQGFVRTRFVNASAGDGTWQPLAYSTRLARARRLRPAAVRGEPAANRITVQRRKFDARVAGVMRSAGVTIHVARQRLVATGQFAILRDTSNLFNSLSAGAPHSIMAIEGWAFIYGTNVYYAAAHQYGTARLPARPFLVPPDAQTAAKVQAILTRAAQAVLYRVFTGGTP